MPITNPEERREYNKRYHKEYHARKKTDPDYQGRLLRNRRRCRSRARKYLHEYKSSSGCLFCGEKIPECLDFHHVDPKTKKNQLSNVARVGSSIELIEREIKKCVVLCANHHRLIEAAIKLRKLNAELFDKLMAQ